MVQSVKAVIEGEADLIAGLAQVTAVIKVYLNEVNWVGFYFLKTAKFLAYWILIVLH
jgi:GAF domain-containing protein